MAGPLNPLVGERVFNGAEFDYLVDLEPSALKGMRTAQRGLDRVLAEIIGNEVVWAEKAGVTTADMTQLFLLNERIARIDEFLAPVLKFAEMLSETRYVLEDQRQHILLNIGASVERRGKEMPELLARYQKTRTYRSAIAKKAAKTRKKNAEEQAEVVALAAEPEARALVEGPRVEATTTTRGTVVVDESSEAAACAEVS
ncbi:hypothetical protein [Chondromyces crocatus]|uniref:Uncharacterized protein n=1 Tax=Chondromyces crocatus TaxID=52 RepID=A0A0K1EMF4_CHOCO|nr:hypothetical protein [Chondromyces crocatus]AKT41813.1 uncharacterized protein CMC5_060240 [Chondromyces crocatus]